MNTPSSVVIQAAIQSVFPSSITLNYVEHDDGLTEEQLALVNDVLNTEITYSEFSQKIYENVEEWLFDCSFTSQNMYIDDIKSSLQIKLDLNDDEIDEIIEVQNDFIVEQLQEKDDSTPIEDLIKHMSNENLRVQMYSNYEGLDSGYNLWRDGVRYSEYFKDIVDVLNLNPAKLKLVLLNHKLKCTLK